MYPNTLIGNLRRRAWNACIRCTHSVGEAGGISQVKNTILNSYPYIRSLLGAPYPFSIHRLTTVVPCRWWIYHREYSNRKLQSRRQISLTGIPVRLWTRIFFDVSTMRRGWLYRVERVDKMDSQSHVLSISPSLYSSVFRSFCLSFPSYCSSTNDLMAALNSCTNNRTFAVVYEWKNDNGITVNHCHRIF